MSSRASRHATWTQRLVRQALAVPHPYDDDTTYTSAEGTLVDLVHRTLERGSDRPIQAALTELSAHDHEDAADLLQFWADSCASTRDDLVTQSTADAEAAPLEATIFLWPIIGLLPPHATWPTTIASDILTPLAQSFRRHGLIGEDPSVLIAPHWYTTADLPLTWSGRRQWLDYGVHALLHDGNQSFFPASHPAATPGSTPSLQLRWIVGVLVDAADGTSHPWLTADLEGFTIDEAIWDAWESTIDHTLTPFFPPDAMLWILRPGEWAATLAEAILDYHHKALSFQFQTVPPTEAVHVRQTEDDTWEIQWTHNGEMHQYPWTIPDAPDDSLLAIVATLRLNAVDSLTIHTLPSASPP